MVAERLAFRYKIDTDRHDIHFSNRPIDYYEIPFSSDVRFVVFRCVNYQPHVILNAIVTDLINALPGNSSVNTVQHATIEKAVFSVDPTDATIDWLDSDHVMCLL
jgi:hypothetical protein